MLLLAAVVTLPQIIGLVAWDTLSRHEAAGDSLTHLLEQTLAAPDAAASCLADPVAWSSSLKPPPPRDRSHPAPPLHRGLVPPTLRAWDRDGQPHAGDTPLPASLGVLSTDTPMQVSAWFSADVDVLIQTGWGGGCEIVGIHGNTVPGFMGSRVPASPLWVAPIVLVATVMSFAVWPVVRRIQRLEQAVSDGTAPVAMPGDDEVALLSRAFDRATASLREEVAVRTQREQALTDFVANTAHDVRTPLTVLRGYLSAMESTPSPEVLAQAIGEAHYIGAILDNLAAHARMQVTPADHPFDLRDVVERATARHQPIARRRGVSLSCGTPAEPLLVCGDLTLTEQALSNLIDNAVRYNQPGGHVAVTLDQEGARFLLEVSDDGPGVTEAELTQLTQRGYRGGAARSRDRTGQGLGLDIVCRVTERHGWSFSLEHSEPSGLCASLSGASHDPS